MVATWLTPGKGKKRPAMLYWRAHKNYILFVVAFAVFTVCRILFPVWTVLTMVSRICFCMEWYVHYYAENE